MTRKTVYIDTYKDVAELYWSNWKKDNLILYKSLFIPCNCGATEYLGIHHKDGDKRNCELSNLKCLCINCHINIHHKIIQVKYKSIIHEPSEKKFDVKAFFKRRKRRW